MTRSSTTMAACDPEGIAAAVRMGQLDIAQQAMDMAVKRLPDNLWTEIMMVARGGFSGAVPIVTRSGQPHHS